MHPIHSAQISQFRQADLRAAADQHRLVMAVKAGRAGRSPIAAFRFRIGSALVDIGERVQGCVEDRLSEAADAPRAASA